MKKLFIPLFLMFLLLTGCGESITTLSEQYSLTGSVQNTVDPELTLQAIIVDEEGYYILFHSSKEVESELET